MSSVRNLLLFLVISKPGAIKQFFGNFNLNFPDEQFFQYFSTNDIFPGD
jgi:hypothetical protein